MTAFADNFLAGSLLTILMPILLLIAISIWYVISVRRVPEETPESSTSLPPPEVVAAAGPDVHDVQPMDPPADQT